MIHETFTYFVIFSSDLKYETISTHHKHGYFLFKFVCVYAKFKSVLGEVFFFVHAKYVRLYKHPPRPVPKVEDDGRRGMTGDERWTE